MTLSSVYNLIQSVLIFATRAFAHNDYQKNLMCVLKIIIVMVVNRTFIFRFLSIILLANDVRM